MSLIEVPCRGYAKMETYRQIVYYTQPPKVCLLAMHTPRLATRIAPGATPTVN